MVENRVYIQVLVVSVFTVNLAMFNAPIIKFRQNNGLNSPKKNILK